jgi:hypothetical protein
LIIEEERESERLLSSGEIFVNFFASKLWNSLAAGNYSMEVDYRQVAVILSTLVLTLNFSSSFFGWRLFCHHHMLHLIARFRIVVASSAIRRSDLLSVRALFSTSEGPQKFLVTDETRLVDLKTELKKRGASVQGKKADLRQRLKEILEKESDTLGSAQQKGIQAVNSRTTPEQMISSITHSQLADDFQNLELALNEKNPLFFEETMKILATSVKSNSKLTLASEEKNFIVSKLRSWAKLEAVSADSI